MFRGMQSIVQRREMLILMENLDWAPDNAKIG